MNLPWRRASAQLGLSLSPLSKCQSGISEYEGSHAEMEDTGGWFPHSPTKGVLLMNERGFVQKNEPNYNHRASFEINSLAN